MSDGSAYIYANNGLPREHSTVGRVVGFAGAPHLGMAYCYGNNGFVDPADAPDGAVYATANVVES